MDSTDAGLEQRVRRAYEIGRARWAVLGFLPALALPAIVMCVDGVSLRTVLLGLGMFALGVVLLWLGRDRARGVLPGLVAGLLPLVGALCAPRMHVCMAGQCMSVCLAVCAGAGLLGGAGIGFVAHRLRASVWFIGTASAVTLATGALGCACVGLGGVLGMAGGFALGLIPSLTLSRDKRAGG
jgi:hypothetical protein